MKTIAVVLALVVASAQAQDDDPVNELFFKAYEEFGERLRVSAAAWACDRPGIAEAVIPKQEAINNYLIAELPKLESGDLTVGVAVEADVMLDGFYLGYAEGLKTMFPALDALDGPEAYCAGILEVADELLTE